MGSIWNEKKDAMLRQLCDRWVSVADMATALGCTVDAIYNRTRRLGIRRVPPSSNYHGVSWDSDKKKWRTTIYRKETGRVLIGRYDSERKAAQAWDVYVKKNRLDKTLNFP